MSKRHNDFHRRRRPAAPHGHERIHLTPEGFPAAVPDAQPVSPVVFVSEESRKRYPWLPARAIAFSVWRGPGHLRVEIGEDGNAVEVGARRSQARVA